MAEKFVREALPSIWIAFPLIAVAVAGGLSAQALSQWLGTANNASLKRDDGPRSCACAEAPRSVSAQACTIAMRLTTVGALPPT